MTRFKLVGAALVLAAFVAAPVSAQQAVQEPGAYAFYHPNGDVLNAGGPRPAPAGGFTQPADSMAQMQMTVRPHRTHHATRHY